MNCRRQALYPCLNALVIIVVQIVNEFLLEVLHGLKLLQIKQFTLEWGEEVFCHSIVQTVSFPAHALPDTFCFEHPLVLFVLVLPALVGVKN